MPMKIASGLLWSLPLLLVNAAIADLPGEQKRHCEFSSEEKEIVYKNIYDFVGRKNSLDPGSCVIISELPISPFYDHGNYCRVYLDCREEKNIKGDVYYKRNRIPIDIQYGTYELSVK